MKRMSLDEVMIPWRGGQKLRTYNRGKLTKYGLLVRMVCEAKSGYVQNIKIYTAEEKKLEDTDLSFLENNMTLNQQIYQDSFLTV
jgi:hypothetical protein